MTRGSNYDTCAETLFHELGADIRVALPLGLGKPIGLIDALYRRASADPSLSLTILTALSLERPSEHDPIKSRLLEPVFARFYGDYREPLYLSALRAQALPANIQVHEFYFRAGSQLGNATAQRSYISSNYTHAARDVAARGCNLVIQLVAQNPEHPQRLSTGCNPDTSDELVRHLRSAGRPFSRVAVVHPDMPYMFGDAELNRKDFDHIIAQQGPGEALFPVPRLLPIPAPDYLIGLRASALVKDGGTLQLGIGSMGDAIVQSLLLRHRDNTAYQQLLRNADIGGPLIDSIGGTAPFTEGLYAATEMFVEGFLHLFNGGILRRQVYDFWALQILINEGLCKPRALDPKNLEQLAELGVRELRGKDFTVLQHHGFFHDNCRYAEGQIYNDSGASCFANVANPDSRAFMAEHCLGTALRNGCVLHGGFFLGSDWFYRSLREMPADRRRLLSMCGVDKINQLDLNPRLYRAQRRDARFINTGLNVSLNGAVASDTLENGQVVSGVGGQYNFVAMAHQLQPQLDESGSSGGGRSILMIRASRTQDGKPVSNIVPAYGACTIPRHLRDIVITEYGVADLRARTDGEVCSSLIEIADSRFQKHLIAQAKQQGLLSADYQLDPRYRHNLPNRVTELVARAGEDLPAYPFGCDFTDRELRTARRLKQINALAPSARIRALMRGFGRSSSATARESEAVDVLNLQGELPLKLRLLRALLRGSENSPGAA
ncbi:acetyl-CoA hydrolase [Spongiibacter sp. KMU-166]|uniref:Acetyl-CoA hydrolase n=1 Tax=Spongiibacter thalassae TaxID=2721624 RepID=A0ABX1GIM7_9GAMM|nr:acetyl-CoA hydrolase/transferase C-terminal domain-containing protein [Spongiibacter thalassae]NKI18258.1 acetyl-CoA hydrolase [Spongiibacter thalassae]